MIYESPSVQLLPIQIANYNRLHQMQEMQTTVPVCQSVCPSRGRLFSECAMQLLLHHCNHLGLQSTFPLQTRPKTNLTLALIPCPNPKLNPNPYSNSFRNLNNNTNLNLNRVWVPGLRIDPLRHLARCRKRRLNQAPLNLRGLIWLLMTDWSKRGDIRKRGPSWEPFRKNSALCSWQANQSWFKEETPRRPTEVPEETERSII